MDFKIRGRIDLGLECTVCTAEKEREGPLHENKYIYFVTNCGG